MDTRSLEEQESSPVRDGVTLTYLAKGEAMNVMHFSIDPGSRAPLHTHPQEQAGYLLQGEFTFLMGDGSEIVIHPNESYVVASEEPHAAENRGDQQVMGIEIFSPPRPPGYWKE